MYRMCYENVCMNVYDNIKIYLKQMFLSRIISILICLHSGLSFDFKQLTIIPDSAIIGTITQYTMLYLRYINNANNETAWNSTAVPSGATITFTFPTQYNLASPPTCISVIISSLAVTGYTCTTSGNTITISGAITSSQNINQVQLKLGNILNPVPAMYLDQFQGTIGSDTAVPNGDGVQLQPATFDNCTVTFDTGYVNQTSTMVITLDPKNALDSTSSVFVDVPNRWTNDINTASTLPVAASMQCVNYSAGVSAAPTCAGNFLYYSITVSNVLTASTTSSFAFGIKQFTSPPTLQPSDVITITSYQGNDPVDTCDVRVSSLIPNPFSNLVVTSFESMTVNTDAGLKFQMTLSDWVNLNDDIEITFPSEITPSFINITGSGAYTATSGSVSGQVLTVVHRRLSTVFVKGAVYTLNFYKIKCPPSTKTSNAITVKIIRNGFAKMMSTATIKAVASTLTGTAIPVISTVGKTTSYNINLVITDGLSPTGMVRITFPSTITPTLATGCATLVGTSVVSSPTCAFDSVSNIITISGMNSSSSNIPAQTLKFTILSVINAPSVMPSGTFSAITYYTTDTSGVVSQGVLPGITVSLGIIEASTVSVVPSSYVVADTMVTYTINFKVDNPIPQGGYIQLTIPNGVTLNVGSISSYCKLSLNSGSFFTTSCAGTTTGSGYYVNFTSVAQASSITAGTTVSLRIQSLFTNPQDTSVVSTFTLKTYHSNSYGIEQLLTGISVQMDTASTMTSMAVTRLSSTNAQSTTYTIRLKQTPALPASAKLTIVFPSSIGISNAITCTSLTSVALTCTPSSNSVVVTLVSAVGSGVQFGAIISNVVNPPSFAPLASSFSFNTKSSDGMLSYGQGTHTSSLVTNIPSLFTYIQGQFSSRVYGQATTLQITVTPSSLITPSYMYVTIPSSFTVPSTLSCSSWSCTSMTSNLVKINGITSTAQIVFTVTGMNAPPSASSSYVVVSSYDSGGFKIDQSTTDISFSTICTMPCRTCSGTNSSACLSCYSDTSISTFIYLDDTASLCYDICPSGTYTDTSVRKCIACNSLCKTCLGSATNCTSCVSTSTYQYLFINSSVGTCRTACPTLYYPDLTTSPIACTLCVIPCLACTTVSQCTSCAQGYYYNVNVCQQTCPTGTTIANDLTNTCDPCSTQCQTCTITVDTCVTCSSTAALYNETCVSVCPYPFVKYNGVCSTCSTKCLQCSITYNNCTKCDTSSTYKYLYNYDCLPACPQLYYASLADGMCKLCSALNIGCNNCTSTSTCGTCNWDQGFVFLSNKCYAVTPSGYYNSSGFALACDTTKDCATCDKLAYNCTACITLNLEGSTCVATCSPGFVGVNKVCMACTNNCKTCVNLQSNCTSCLPGLSPPVYLSNSQCVTKCPDYTYANDTNSQCTACEPSCQKCTSRTQCTTCLSGSFFHNNQCPASCPYGYLGINRICQRCTPPCDDCTLSLTKCTSCLPTNYLITSTSRCDTVCPTGLYPNDAQGACTGCVSPCNTCSTTASTCTSCLNSLLLHQGGCVPNCPDGYYSLNSQCNECNVNCSTCTSSSVCQSCKIGFYLYTNNCIDKCPSTHPVTTTGACTPCSDTNCIVCDYLDQCSQCNYPTLLLSGHCLTDCPVNYTSNGTNCNYDPKADNTTTNNDTNNTLSQSLSSANLFPVPFTIAALFIGIACIMSRFQHSYTFLSGALYSVWSLLEMGSLGTAVYFYYNTNKDLIALNSAYVQVFIFVGAIAFMYLLNLLALITQNCYLRGDDAFKRWRNRQSTNQCFYMFSSIIGLVLTHKFKNILFCKLFGFQVFKAKLDSLQNFKIFNAFSFLSFIPSAAILFSTGYMIYKHHLTDQQLMAYIDVIVLTVLCIVLAILNSRKDNDFFEEKDEEGVIINKRIISGDSIMHDAIVPFMFEDQDHRGNMTKNNFQTDRKFKSIDTISQSASSFDYHQVKEMQNVSVQAAPVLQDFSRINFYNDEQLSDISMFKKVDKSMNVSKRLNMNQISIQNDGNILDQKEVSIQHNPKLEDISMQHQIDARDISLQNVPNVDNYGVQMSRHEQDHSIQCGVLVNNASIQYSAKPVFQNISQDFIDSEQDQEKSQQANHSRTFNQQPADDPKGLKAQLQLDVDEKLRKKQEELQLEREEQRERQKQQLIDRFHQEQDRKNNEVRQNPFEKVDDGEKVNKLYNNENSRIDGSSLMDSDANIMTNFRKNRKNNESNSRDNKQEQKSLNESSNNEEKRERAPSAKTEKQFIQMLSNKGEPGLDLESSMSFNVTRDLEQANGRKIKNVVYQEQDRAMDSDGGDDIQLENAETRKGKKQVYILQNDTGQQLPSGFDKSRSTNFRSTVRDGRRPPLPNRTNSNNILNDSSNMENSFPDNGYQEIIYNPIRPKMRQIPPQTNYKEQDLNYQDKTNLNKFLDRKKKHVISAHPLRSKIQFDQQDEGSDNGNIQQKQNPLPLPKIQRLKSQQSNYSADMNDRHYKMSSKKVLLEDRKLEFNDKEKISLNTQQDQFDSMKQLPKLRQSQSKLRNSRSQTKMHERDSFEKPIHRELLGKERFVDRTQKFLQKEHKKAQNTKKKIQMMQVMLERPSLSSEEKGYLKDTYTSQDRKRKSSMQKVYLNNPYEKKL